MAAGLAVSRGVAGQLPKILPVRVDEDAAATGLQRGDALLDQFRMLGRNQLVFSRSASTAASRAASVDGKRPLATALARYCSLCGESSRLIG